MGQPPAGLVGVSSDSRRVGSGELYVALKGARFDGHDFVQAAREQGAAAAVVERGSVQSCVRLPLLQVADTHLALRNLAAGYRDAVAPRLVGITGSVGKSTVKELAAAMLGRAHRTACTCGNWNNDIGLPLSLLAMPPDTAYGVFEVGTNHPGEITDLCRLLQPDWGVVTCIGPSHLEFFGSVDAVAREKSRLPAALPEDGVAFLDADEPYYPTLCESTPARVVSISLGADASLVATNLDAGADAVLIHERESGQRIELPRPLPGDHQVRNLLLAVAVAREAGLDWDAIRAGLDAFVPMPMRWDCRRIGGVLVVNDAYNANPVSMQAALQTFRQMPGAARRWLVLGDMLELGNAAMEAHAELGRIVAGGDWEGVATVGPLAAAIVEAVRKAGKPVDAAAFDAVDEAGAWLCGRLATGDAVLLKGSRSIHLESVVDIIANDKKGQDDVSGT